MEFIIAPSILACDLSRLGEELRVVEDAGADWHHVDVMDGHFVPNLTFGPDICKAVKTTGSLFTDVHLMVTNPENFVEPFIEAGADMVTFHIEVGYDAGTLLRRIHRLGARAGLVVRPKTPVSTVFPHLGDADMVLVMTVEPGYTGQAFMRDCVAKVAELRREAGESLDIQVDGGINEATAAEVAAAGANVIVAGASVYRSGDVAAAIRAIRSAVERNYEGRPETRR